MARSSGSPRTASRRAASSTPDVTSSWAGLAAGDLDPALDARLALADRRARRGGRGGRRRGAGAATTSTGRRAMRSRATGDPATLWAVHPDADVREAATGGDGPLRGVAQSRVRAPRPVRRRWRPSTNPPWRDPRRRHLSLWRSSQRINGAHLDDAGRAELERLLGRASELAVAVSAAFTDDLPHLEVPPAALDGLAAEVIARFEPGAPGTVRVPVDYQTRDAFLAQVRDRGLRERFWRALQDRGLATSLEPMRELFETRRQIARLSGFESWAALRTATSSVRSVGAAEAILDGMAGPSRSGRRGVHRGVQRGPRGPAARRRLPAVGPVRRDRRPHPVDRRRSRGLAVVPDGRRGHRRAVPPCPRGVRDPGRGATRRDGLARGGANRSP